MPYPKLSEAITATMLEYSNVLIWTDLSASHRFPSWGVVVGVMTTLEKGSIIKLETRLVDFSAMDDNVLVDSAFERKSVDSNAESSVGGTKGTVGEC